MCADITRPLQEESERERSESLKELFARVRRALEDITRWLLWESKIERERRELGEHKRWLLWESEMERQEQLSREFERFKLEMQQRPRSKRELKEFARISRERYHRELTRKDKERCLKQHIRGREREQEQHIAEGQRLQQSTPGREAKDPQTTRSCSSLPRQQPLQASSGPLYCTSFCGSSVNRSLLSSSGYSTDQPGPNTADYAIQTKKSPQARHHNTSVGESRRSGLSSTFLSGASSATESETDQQRGYSRGQSSTGFLSQGSVTGNASPSQHCDETMLKTARFEYADQEHGDEQSQNAPKSIPQATALPFSREVPWSNRTEYYKGCKGTHSGSEGDLNEILRNTTRRTQGEFQEQFQRNISSDRSDATAVTDGGFLPAGQSGYATDRPTQQSSAHACFGHFLGAENRDEFSRATGRIPQETTGDIPQQTFNINVVNKLSFNMAPGSRSQPHESFLFGNGCGMGHMQEPQVQQDAPPARGAQRERQNEQPSFSFRTPVQCSEK